MFKLNSFLRIVLLAGALFLFVSCTPQTTQPGSGATSSGAAENHGDEDHGDEHGDADHGDEHSDEDHGDEHREHGAHEHGAAELTVALIDGQAEIMLETPAFNLVGFEYAAKTDEEKAAVDAATETLEKGEWFALTDAAGCSLSSADVNSSMAEGEEHHDEEGHDEEEGDHHDEEGHESEKETHSSFFATYMFNCSSLEDLASLDATMLFSSFPNFEAVDAQWLNDTQQSAATLDKDRPVLSFE